MSTKTTSGGTKKKTVDERNPRVLHKYRDQIPEGAVYIGRPSVWGNPYPLRSGAAKWERDECIESYVRFLDIHPELKEKARRELKGKDLVCFCAPLACHGDILIVIANGWETDHSGL